jgi:hypothetical protein
LPLVSISDADDPTKRQTAIDGFVAVNALVVTLLDYDEEAFKGHRTLALWTFRSALEYPQSMPEDDAEQEWEGHVLAAAVMVEIAGEKIQNWDFEFESGPWIGDMGAGGPLWNGKHGFCKGRWELWQRRFFELSAGPAVSLLSDEAREKARLWRDYDETECSVGRTNRPEVVYRIDGGNLLWANLPANHTEADWYPYYSSAFSKYCSTVSLICNGQWAFGTIYSHRDTSQIIIRAQCDL